MMRLIDADEFFQDFSEEIGIYEHISHEYNIDAVEVKYGEWIFNRGDGKTCVDGWTCSACGNLFHTNVPYFEEFHYCPNCGARMQKRAEQ